MKLTQQLVTLQTLTRKEISRVTRIWVQTIVPPIITMSLYFIIFGNLIGRRIGQMDGFDYMQYIAPGLIMMSVIQNAYGNVVSSFFGAKFQKHLEEMLVSPMPTYAIIIGHVSGGVFRGLIVGSIVTVIALFFTKLQIANLFVTVSIVVLTAIVFALAGLIFLFDLVIARVSAKGFIVQSNFVHGQCISVRHAWRFGYRHQNGLWHHGRIYRPAVQS